MSLAQATSRVDSGLAADQQVFWAACDCGAIAEEARRRLDLGPLAAVAFGRTMAGAAMLLRLSSKRTRRLEVVVEGDGPLKRVRVEVDRDGAVRGLVANKHVAIEGPELRVGPAIGEGHLRVIREEDNGRVYESRVLLQSGEIGVDLAHYLSQSEQRSSAVLVGVLANQDGIASAGGLLIEALPGCSAEVISELERRTIGLGSVSRALAREGLGGILEEVMGHFDPVSLSTNSLEYRCRCGRDKLASRLATLDEAEIEELTSGGTGPIDAECAYCGEIYSFQRDELVSQRPADGEVS